MPRVYAKARNNDPAVPFNYREKQFKSGRGFAVDIRVRDYNGSAAQRYAEGVIIDFWESAEEAERVARDVNSGKRYGPGHHLHVRAYSAIVVPAWNASDDPDEALPWETRQGSAEMVAAYDRADVPLPQWLRDILAKFQVEGEGDAERRTTDESAPTRDDLPPISGDSAESDSVASGIEFSSLAGGTDAVEYADARAETFDDEFLAMVLESVRVGEVIATLGTGRPNRIASVNREGLRVVTERSDQKGTGPQLVPAWMVTTAWDHLQRHGHLSQNELLNDLSVKRSAFVCALLSRFPGVEVETTPNLGLRLAAGSAPAEPDFENEASHVPRTESRLQQEQPHIHGPEVSGTSATAERWEASAYAARLNLLFDTVHANGRGPYTSEEVAEQLQADGLPLHVNTITRLRRGIGEWPADRISDALAFFFNVDAAYFLDDPSTDPQQNRHREPVDEPAAPAHADRKATEPDPPDALEDNRSVGLETPSSELDLSFAQVINIIAGLGEATKRCVESHPANEDLARRLAFLVSETAPLLLQALMGDVTVSRRFLERVKATWAETDPIRPGTASYYRQFAALLY